MAKDLTGGKETWSEVRILRGGHLTSLTCYSAFPSRTSAWLGSPYNLFEAPGMKRRMHEQATSRGKAHCIMSRARPYSLPQCSVRTALHASRSGLYIDYVTVQLRSTAASHAPPCGNLSRWPFPFPLPLVFPAMRISQRAQDRENTRGVFTLLWMMSTCILHWQ